MNPVRKSYTTSQKLKVTAFAKNNSVAEAANNFDVSQSMVGRWKANEHNLAYAPANARKIGSGPTPHFPREEQCLFDDFCQRRSLGYMVSCSDLQCKMRQLVNEQRFRASAGWLHGFPP